MHQALDGCTDEPLLAIVADISKACLHDLGETVQNNSKIDILLLANFAFHDLGDDIEQRGKELVIDDLIDDLLWVGDETGIDDLFTLVLCVGDVVVEFHYFF